jgi:hypothetical protein
LRQRRNRRVLSQLAIRHDYFTNRENPAEEHINEKMHWSVIAKHRRTEESYSPANFPRSIEPAQIADITPEERALTS